MHLALLAICLRSDQLPPSAISTYFQWIQRQLVSFSLLLPISNLPLSLPIETKKRYAPNRVCWKQAMEKSHFFRFSNFLNLGWNLRRIRIIDEIARFSYGGWCSI